MMSKREALAVLKGDKPTNYYTLQEAIYIAIEVLEESIANEDDGK